MTDQRSMPTMILPTSPSAAAPKSRGRSRLLDTILLSRRRRRKLISEIEAATGRTLLCYVSLGPGIGPQDMYDLMQLLNGIDSGASITLLLDSLGGEIDSAEGMVRHIQNVCQSPSATNGDLEVVVPYQAKSAATLLALGADRILMSNSSELGPIDPQIPAKDGHLVPVLALIRAYEQAEERCKKYPDNAAFAAQLAKFDPNGIEMMRLAVKRAQSCAEGLLMRRGGNYTSAPAALVDIERFPSHGQMIDWRTARRIGIPHVHPMDQQSALWQQYWHLYQQLRDACGAERRILESRDESLLLTVNARESASMRRVAPSTPS